ncbi:MAG TPA: SDR family NAD(P)-dependent oxidoreductase, partial [Thermoleophilia bacterium]|nr:SDR family NAD(P)-dependent oxidoreductase [Thermoleophilia bacterium]
MAKNLSGELEGCRTLITGATGGVGPAVARVLAEAGSQLVLVSRGHDKLEDLAASLGLPETDCLIHACDLTDSKQAKDLMIAMLGCPGPLTGIVNLIGRWEAGKVTTLNDEAWHGMLAANLHAVFYVLREVVPHLADGAAIINVGGELPIEGKGGQLAYSVAKGGVLTLTKSLALELKPRNIRVNAILPKNIDTPDNRAFLPGHDTTHWVRPQEV